jgi:L-amino acid N-acyltransferase YncA
MTPVDGRIVELGPEQTHALHDFFRRLPEGDMTFVKENVTDAATVQSWASPAAGRRRWVALDGTGQVVGFAAVLALSGWSDHVGEVRLVVDASVRRQGWGRRLARHALAEAVAAGLTKLVVEVVAEQEATLAMFTSLGFTAEALLRDHIRDRNGKLRDLVVMAHFVQPTWAAMTSVGLSDEVGDPTA